MSEVKQAVFVELKNDLKAIAYEWWTLGVPVVSLEGKRPLVEWAKWQTQQQTREEFEGLPWERADGFAIICGAKTKDGFYVGALDFDVKNLPEEVIAKGREALKHMPITQIEQTPSKGLHYVYYCIEKPKSLSAYHNVCGLELLGESKLCIMAPSAGYRRLNDNTPTIIKSLNEVFEAALKKAGIQVKAKGWFSLKEPTVESYRGAHPPCIQALLEGVDEGLRNETGIRLASYFLNFRGLSWNKALAHLEAWNSRNRPPLPQKELESILKSAEAHGYVYGCEDEILKAKCNRGKCVFGVKNLSPTEAVKLALLESESIEIHPLIDYNPAVGLVLGVPLYNNTLPRVESHNVLFLAEKAFLVKNGVIKKEEGFAYNISLRKARWLDISQTCYRQMLLSSLEFFEKGEISFPSKKEVFEKTLEGITKYWWYPDERYYTLVVCWAIGTYFHPIFNYYPILNAQGERGTGKTTLLEILKMICWNSTDLEAALREAPLFRTIQDSRPTYLMDITKLNQKSKNYTDVVDVCEAGSEKGHSVKRINKETGEPLIFHVYGPKAIASRHELPFTAKCIRIITEKASNKNYGKIRHALEQDSIWEDAVGLCIRAAIKYWPEVVKAYTELQPTEKLYGRMFNYWAPLLAVCKVFAGDKFNELLALAEEYASTETVEDALTEVENGILTVFLSMEGETATITLKELTEKVKEAVPWVETWHVVKSALENLHVVKQKYRTANGLTFRINLELAHRKAHERFIENNGEGSSSREEHTCEKCGSKAYTVFVRADGEHWLCGKCVAEWEGSL
jgi:ribosomal protein S27AE